MQIQKVLAKTKSYFLLLYYNMYLEIEVNGELKKFNVFPSTKMDKLQRTYVYLKTEPEFPPTEDSARYRAKVRFYTKKEITPDAGKLYELQKLNNYLQTPLPILLDYPVKAKYFKFIIEDGEFDESELELKIFNGSHSDSQKANNYNVDGNKVSFTEEKILLGIRSSKINKLKFQYSNDGTNFKNVKNVEVPKINLSCSSLLNTSYNFGDISLNESKILQILGIGLPNYESGKGKVMAYLFFYKKFGNTYIPRKLELIPNKGSVGDNLGRLIKVSSDGSKLIASANYYISVFSLSNDYSKFELLENINLSELTSLINNISISGNGRFLTYSAEDTDQVQLWEDKTSTKRKYEEIPGYRDISSSFSTIKRINSNFLEFNALNFTASNIMDNNNDYGPEGLRSSDLSTYLGNIWIAGKGRTGIYNRGIAQNNRLGNNREKGEYVRVDFGIPFKMTKFEVFGHDHIGAHHNPKNLTIYASNEPYEDNNNVDLQKVFAKTNITQKLIFGSESVNGKKILITSQDEYRYYYFVFGDIQVISTHPDDAFCVKVRHLKFYDHQEKVYKNFKFNISDKITKDYNADDEEYEYYQTGEIYYNDNKANFWYHGKKGIIYLNSNKSDNNLLADQ